MIFLDSPPGHGDGDQPGQRDRVGCPAPVAGKAELARPNAVAADGTNLVIADGSNNRIRLLTG
ncbi:MAG: hypothetical protein ACRDNF_24390 [Streptosporangiaceae bacterium]